MFAPFMLRVALLLSTLFGLAAPAVYVILEGPTQGSTANEILPRPDSYINMDHSDYSWYLWVRPHSFPPSGTLRCIYERFDSSGRHAPSMYINDSGKVVVLVELSSGVEERFESTASLQLNHWTHIHWAAKSDSSKNCRLYFNSLLAGPIKYTTGNSDFKVISSSSAKTYYCSGTAADVEIYKLTFDHDGITDPALIYSYMTAAFPAEAGGTIVSSVNYALPNLSVRPEPYTVASQWNDTGEYCFIFTATLTSCTSLTDGRSTIFSRSPIAGSQWASPALYVDKANSLCKFTIGVSTISNSGANVVTLTKQTSVAMSTTSTQYGFCASHLNRRADIWVESGHSAGDSMTWNSSQNLLIPSTSDGIYIDLGRAVESGGSSGGNVQMDKLSFWDVYVYPS